MSKIPQRQLRELKYALNAARMNPGTVGFGDIGEKVGDQSVTDFVIKKTRIYRETWIIPQLEAVIKWAEE